MKLSVLMQVYAALHAAKLSEKLDGPVWMLIQRANVALEAEIANERVRVADDTKVPAKVGEATA